MIKKKHRDENKIAQATYKKKVGNKKQKDADLFFQQISLYLSVDYKDKTGK